MQVAVTFRHMDSSDPVRSYAEAARDPHVAELGDVFASSAQKEPPDWFALEELIGLIGCIFQITVSLGAEIGYNPGAVDDLLAMLDAFPFAHRGLSCHFFFDGREHLNMLSRRTDHIKKIAEFGTEPILDAYFRNLIQGCQDIPCDKLCHLDAALRHNTRHNAPALTAYHYDLIDELFTVMLKNNIALGIVLAHDQAAKVEFGV